MSNLLTMLYTGASGVQAAQTQIAITGHNIANIDNPEYTKQRVNVKSQHTSSAMDGAFGYGVRVEEVVRVYDELLANTLRGENTALSYWGSTQKNLSEILVYFDEMKEGSRLGDALRDYFNGWQELHNAAPDSTDSSIIKRTQLITDAGILCTKINDAHKMFTDLQAKIDTRLKGDIKDINIMTKAIAELNEQIVSVEAVGDHANDLRDKRDALLNKITSMANVSHVERPNGEIAIFFGGLSIVDGRTSHELKMMENKEAGKKLDIYWTNDKGVEPINVTEHITGGSIGAELKMRDQTIPGYMKDLDELASTLIKETNKIHASGQGLDRFSNVTATNRVNNPLFTFNSELGKLPNEIKQGAFRINVYDSNNQVISHYDITVGPNDTLAGIASKINMAEGSNGDGMLSAVIGQNNELSIKCANGHTFAFGEDTSGFLVAAGFNNFFSGTSAKDIQVDSRVVENPRLVAASSGGAPGDNRVAKAMVEMKKTTVASNGTVTIDEFYGFFSGSMASNKKQVDIFFVAKTATVKQYTLKFESISGVVMSDEQANLVQFQRVFEANSRYINAVDEMLNLIVNSLGLVGR